MVALVNPATLLRRAKAWGRSPRSDIRPLSESELGASDDSTERGPSILHVLPVIGARVLQARRGQGAQMVQRRLRRRKLTVAHSLSEQAGDRGNDTCGAGFDDSSSFLIQLLDQIGTRKRAKTICRPEPSSASHASQFSWAGDEVGQANESLIPGSARYFVGRTLKTRISGSCLPRCGTAI